MTTNYPNKLKHFRTRRKLTQQQVIDELGQESPSRLSSWEQGSAMPSLPNLFKLCKLYNTTSEKLYPKLNTKIKKAKRQPPQEPVIEESMEMTIERELATLAEIIVDAYFYQIQKYGKLPTFEKLDLDK